MPALVGWDDPKENVAGSLETSVSSQCCQKPEWLEHQQILLQEKSLKKQPVPCQCPLQVAKEEVSRGKQPRGAAILHRSLVSAAHCKIPSIHDIKSAPSLKGFYFRSFESGSIGPWFWLLRWRICSLSTETHPAANQVLERSQWVLVAPLSALACKQDWQSSMTRWQVVVFWMWQEISCSLPNKWLKVLEGYQTQPQTQLLVMSSLKHTQAVDQSLAIHGSHRDPPRSCF